MKEYRYPGSLFHLLPLVAFLLVAITTCYGAGGTRDDSYIIYIGNLNYDSIADTLRGYRDSTYQLTPDRICWGQIDSSRINSHKKAPAPLETTIEYPNWRKIAMSVAVQDVNADTVTDIIFYFWGDAGDVNHKKDTLRSLVVFGQSGLQKTKKINLATINNGFQERPFFAMDLRLGSGLKQKGRRDPSGRSSYILEKISHTVKQGDTSHHSAPNVLSVEPTVSIYPNPAAYATNVEVKKLQPGDYRVELVAVNGMRYRDQEINVGTSGEFLQMLQLSDVPGKDYVVQVFTSNTVVGSYPVVVVH